MVNSDKLVGAIFSRGFNKSTFAEKLGKCNSWLSGRLKNKNFTLAEADEIVKTLNLSSAEATAIFFAQFVA